MTNVLLQQAQEMQSRLNKLSRFIQRVEMKGIHIGVSIQKKSRKQGFLSLFTGNKNNCGSVRLDFDGLTEAQQAEIWAMLKRWEKELEEEYKNLGENKREDDNHDS